MPGDDGVGEGFRIDCPAGWFCTAAEAADQLYERTLMTTADARCRLFAPPISAALDAARTAAREQRRPALVHLITSAEDIARICHAHPSLSEATKEAALAVDKRTLNF